MNKVYCPSCFCVTEYTQKKPNFCSSCSKPFIESVQSIANIKETNTRPKFEPRITQKAIIEDDEEIIEVPQNVKIQFEILGNLRQNRQTFNQVLEEGFQNKGRILPLPPARNKTGKKEKPLNKQTIAKTWQENFPKNGQRNEIG